VHSSGLFHRTEVAVEPGQGFFDEFVPGRDVVGFIHFNCLSPAGVPNRSNIGLADVSRP